jgi:hypothetical protein
MQWQLALCIHMLNFLPVNFAGTTGSMTAMFSGASLASQKHVFNQSLSSWDVGNVEM